MTSSSIIQQSNLAQNRGVHRIVLVGGGHTHALVLHSLSKDPIANADITLINPYPLAPYSGMLPGYVAGHYPREALNIDLVQTAQRAGARLVQARAIGFDLTDRFIILEAGERVSYDLASLDVGVTSELPKLKGFEDHAVAAKPFAKFTDRWEAYRVSEGPKRIVIIGGGVAGVELALAMQFAFRTQKTQIGITIIDRGQILSTSRGVVQRHLRRRLDRSDISLLEHESVEEVTDEGVALSSGRQVAANFVLSAAGATSHTWLEQTGLRVQDGFVVTDQYLQTSAPGVFAVGDCAQSESDPRPKAGVYAVRQAPVLLNNVKRSLSGRPLMPFRPQSNYLKLISLGQQTALGEKYGITLSGRWVWRLKDRIDQRFMRQFSKM